MRRLPIRATAIISSRFHYIASTRKPHWEVIDLVLLNREVFLICLYRVEVEATGERIRGRGLLVRGREKDENEELRGG